MKEILFRGKRVDSGEWLYGFYHNETSIESPASDRKITHHHIYTQDFDLFVDPETIGQYTGLCDKNGKKIYEGDIVKCDTYFDKPQLVKWDKKWCVFQPIFDASPIEVFPILSITNQIEVIGNIHDNSKLLEE